MPFNIGLGKRPKTHIKLQRAITEQLQTVLEILPSWRIISVNAILSISVSWLNIPALLIEYFIFVQMALICTKAHSFQRAVERKGRKNKLQGTSRKKPTWNECIDVLPGRLLCMKQLCGANVNIYYYYYYDLLWSQSHTDSLPLIRQWEMISKGVSEGIQIQWQQWWVLAVRFCSGGH